MTGGPYVGVISVALSTVKTNLGVEESRSLAAQALGPLMPGFEFPLHDSLWVTLDKSPHLPMAQLLHLPNRPHVSNLPSRIMVKKQGAP